MIDVETVFEQFKAGVAEQVSDDDSDTHFDLGIAYKEMGLFADARREFQVAMADPRRRCLCWTMIGLIYMEEGQPRDAIEAFQSGLESPEKTPREAVGMHYELAMACDARVCGTGVRVIAAQPEPNLGILPGAGGTQRLPRLVGFEHAATMLRTGKPISSAKAVEIGLVREEVDGEVEGVREEDVLVVPPR